MINSLANVSTLVQIQLSPIIHQSAIKKTNTQILNIQNNKCTILRTTHREQNKWKIELYAWSNEERLTHKTLFKCRIYNNKFNNYSLISTQVSGFANCMIIIHLEVRSSHL